MATEKRLFTSQKQRPVIGGMTMFPSFLFISNIYLASNAKIDKKLEKRLFTKRKLFTSYNVFVGLDEEQLILLKIVYSQVVVF